MKIIDSHFHIYKSEQAGLMAQGGASFTGFSGTLDEALPVLDRGKISKIMALAVIPISPMRQAAIGKWPRDASPSQREHLAMDIEEKLQSRLADYNDWLCRIARDDGRIEPVIAADATVDFDFMENEILSKLQSYGIRALKIHPAVNGLSPAHEGYQRIYKLAEEKDIAVISHGGLSADDLEGKYCSPGNYREVLNRFPNLKLVIAHLAFPHVKALLVLASEFPNFYTDISFVLRNSPLSDDEFCEIIRTTGSRRVLFGSDFPWSDPESDVDRLLKMDLKNDELEMIAWRNAEEFFGIGS